MKVVTKYAGLTKTCWQIIKTVRQQLLTTSWESSLIITEPI